QDREQDQPGHDESPVAHPVHLLNPAADRRAEDDEVEAGGDHRRRQRLHQGAQPSRHLEQEDGLHRIEVHARRLTRVTKISSRELSLVCRSLKSMPWAFSRRSSSAMPVCSPWASKVKVSVSPSSDSSSGASESSGGTWRSGACS